MFAGGVELLPGGREHAEQPRGGGALDDIGNAIGVFLGGGLFLAGASVLALSYVVRRKALARRAEKAAVPPARVIR